MSDGVIVMLGNPRGHHVLGRQPRCRILWPAMRIVIGLVDLTQRLDTPRQVGWISRSDEHHEASIPHRQTSTRGEKPRPRFGAGKRFDHRILDAVEHDENVRPRHGRDIARHVTRAQRSFELNESGFGVPEQFEIVRDMTSVMSRR